MISRDELTRIALKKGFKNLATIEKDYALTWALKAIYSNDKLAKYLIFKGGTCLSKVYAETYRLSEDLDFSGNREGILSFEELELELDSAFIKANEDGAPNLQIRKDETHGNAEYIAFKVKYSGPLGHPGTIKLELKKDEIVIRGPKNLPMTETAYSDIAPFKIHCYHFFEMYTEKLRAILQRGKSRDYYDVWQMLTNPALRKNLPKMIFEIRRDLKDKCIENGIEYAPEKIFGKDRVKEAKTYWKDTLSYLVTDLPDFDKVIADMEKELFEEAELAEFNEDFDTAHIRNIARQTDSHGTTMPTALAAGCHTSLSIHGGHAPPFRVGSVAPCDSGILIIRAMELVGQRLESKKTIEVEIALAAVSKMHALLSHNKGWAIAMSLTWKPQLSILGEDKDAKIADTAKSHLKMLGSSHV